MDHRKVAERVIKDVGRDNIIAGAHCATRLRLVLKDDSKVDQKALDNDPDVKGTFKTNGQYQVIIGPGDVNDVYDEFIKITGLKELSTSCWWFVDGFEQLLDFTRSVWTKVSCSDGTECCWYFKYDSSYVSSSVYFYANSSRNVGS